MTRLLNRFLFPAAFGAGLALLGWIAAGYAGHHLLALAVTLLVAAFYVAGALELHRFRRATATLDAALAALNQPPAALDPWLGTLHPALRQPVRNRVEGARNPLPGPALAPFLAGLLVLLGMLGTFLGMVATLQGTGLALGQAGDLQALRDALSAPVKGLGLAFGTSVAGIAASAALGLMAALARRERAATSHRLDAALATHLRGFTPAQRRDDAFALLQQQAAALPPFIDRLGALMTTLAEQQQATHTRLATQQAEALALLAQQQREAGERQGRLQQQSRDDLLAQQREAAAQLQALHAALRDQLQGQQQDFHAKADAAHAALASAVGQSLQAHLAEGTRLAAATLQPVAEATLAGIARETAALHERITQAGERQVAQLAERVEAGSAAAAAHWEAALASHRAASEQLTAKLNASLELATQALSQRSAALVDQIGDRLDTSATHLAQHAAALGQGMDAAHQRLHAELAARDEQRLAAWTGALHALAESLQQQWRAAGEHATAQQQQISQTLARTAEQMGAQAESHARATIAEISRLVDAAAEAPRVAAAVVAELRQKLSDSMARDNGMLEERTRLLGTLATLLDAVNHASTEQRAAIDGLVTSTAAVLQQAGERFAAQVQAEADHLSQTSAQLSAGAAEVASLGEAFGAGVQHFGASNDKLVEQLARIEAGLSQSLQRSDEQLAYYVAQAREVIDLSILSQQQIVQELQQLAARERATV
jgi:Domain of unknown function (DUF802)